MAEEPKPISVDVLAERIAGLIKSTDLSFGAVKESLARIELISANFVSRNELDEVKKDFVNQIIEIKKSFSSHSEDDKVSFGGILKKLDFIMRTVFIGIGGLGVVEFGLQIWAQFHK